jgi:fatty acid desaturase
VTPEIIAVADTPTASTLSVREAPPEMPIPDRLNVVLVVVVSASAVALLWLASHVGSWWEAFGVGIVFSYVLLTNYALLHEAGHGNLHSSFRMNRLLGTVAGVLFPMPYSMFRVMHQGHHLRNRTDYEMFDLYYPTDSKPVRFVQWYGILCGFFWPFVPLGAVLFALAPGALRTRVFRQARSSSYLIGDVRDADLGAIRFEVALTVAFFGLLFWLLDLAWRPTLILYACFSFNWSTRQYVAHAFSRRHVIEGAWNLKHLRFMSWILLHGELDLNHHRRPEVSWYYLPRLTRADDPQVGYLRQYFRQWLGPRPNVEPAPETLESLPLSVHS